MVSAPLNRTHGRQELETIYREDLQPKVSAGVVPPPSPFAQSDVTPIIDNQVAGAKRRFRTRERPPEHVDGTTNHVNRAVEFMSTPNSSQHNSSQQGSDLCPLCSLPLLHQDLKQTDGNYMFLCQSSSSTTTRGLRSKGSAGTSTLAYSVLDDFSLHDYDISGSLPKQPLIAPSSCDFLGPVQCLLEEFVGSYCDSLCTLKSNSNPASERDAASTKQVPPYCANCKAYIVQEIPEDEKQDEMLQNLVAWLAASSSTEDDGPDAKISKVAFRPSKGKIEIMKGSRPQPFLNRGDSAGSLSTEGSARPPIHPRGNRKNEAPYPRTPRSAPPPSGFQEDRYFIDDSSDSQERKRAGGPMRFSRSRSPRRRSYLNLLDDQGNNDQVATAVMPTKPAPVDPSPRVFPSQLPSGGIDISSIGHVKPLVVREDPPESMVGVPVLEHPPQAFNVPTSTSSERPLSPTMGVFTATSSERPLSPKVGVFTVTSLSQEEAPLSPRRDTTPTKVRSPTKAKSKEASRATPMFEKGNPTVSSTSSYEQGPQPVQAIHPTLAQTQDRVRETVSPVNPPQVQRSHDLVPWPEASPRVASPVRSPRKERRDVQQRARPQRHEHNQDIVVTSMQQPNAQFIVNNPEGQPTFLPPSREPEIVLSPRQQQQQHPSLNGLNDDSSIGTCNTLKEEEVIIGDYDEKRNIATKAIGRNLMEGFALTQLQCGHCEMPMMERDGVTECVVCPLVSKKAKKRAHSKRMGQAMGTFDSEASPWLSHGAQQHLQDQLNEHVDHPQEVIKHQTSPSRALEARKSSNDTFDEREPIQGEHIDWEEREFDQTERMSFPDDDDVREVAIYEAEVGSLPSYEEVNDGGYEEVNNEGSDFKDDNSEAELENMEMASQEVYRRLLGGWLLTSSTCTRCNAPLMKSTTGEVSCVVCTSNDSTATTVFSMTEGVSFEHPTSPRDSIFAHQRVRRVRSPDENDRSIALSPETNVSPRGDEMQQRTRAVYTPEEDTRVRAVYTPEEDTRSSGRPRPEVESPQLSRPVTTKEGLRYLAIPENLDLDDHEALLSFLATNRNQERASGGVIVHREQRSRLVSPGSSHRNTGSHQLTAQSPQNLQRHSARDAPGGSDDSRPDPSGAAITEVVSSNSSSTLHTPIQLVSHGEATKRESDHRRRVPDFVSRDEYIISDANHKSTEAKVTTNSVDFVASVSKTDESLVLQEKSFQGNHDERQQHLTFSKTFHAPSVSEAGRSGKISVEFGASDPKTDESLVLQEKSFQGNHDERQQHLTYSKTFHAPSASEAGHSGTGAIFDVVKEESKSSAKFSVRGMDSPASARNNSDSKMNGSPLLLLPAPSSLDIPIDSPSHDYASRENYAPAPESVHSETSGIFEVVEDHSDLLLRFDGTNRQQSLIRPECRPPSPRRPMQSRTRDVNIGSREVPQDDYVLRHSIKLPVKPKPICNVCKTFLKPDAAAEDLVCDNPQCTIFMIPTDSINLFTSAMKDTAREEIMSGSSDGVGLTLLTTRDIVADSQYSFDRWDLITRTTPSVESPSGRSYRSKPLSPSTDGDVFSTSTGGGVMSRAGSMESFKSINSDTLDIMLSRMKDTRSQLVQSNNNSPLAEDGDKTEITQLIDRLASAAVAIKDLEQHVVDVDDLSPQHLLQGRPPTSPRSNVSPSRRAELVDVHWF